MGANWKELRTFVRTLEDRDLLAREELVLTRRGNRTASAYANRGAGRPPVRTLLTRRWTGVGAPLRCISGADARPRFAAKVQGLDPFPDGFLGSRV